MKRYETAVEDGVLSVETDEGYPERAAFFADVLTDIWDAKGDLRVPYPPDSEPVHPFAPRYRRVSHTGRDLLSRFENIRS